MGKYHIAASGFQAGEVVPCTAEKACRLSSEEEHVYFNDAKEAKEYSELLIAKEASGIFGGGMPKEDEQRLAELEVISNANRLGENL